MSALSQLKLGLALIGLILFGYGMRVDDNRLRWMGMGFLAAATILRFVKPRRPPDEPPRA
jgi:hypothetical protein